MGETCATAAPQSVDVAEKGMNGWSLALGAVLMISGILALMTPVATTVFTAMLLGWFLMFVGIIQFIGAIVERKTGGMWMGMSLGALAFVLGLMLLGHIVTGLVSVTLLVGILFLIDGLVKSFNAVISRPAHWGWMLTSGLISLVLAVMILTKLLVATLTLLGMLVGVYMLFAGMEIIVMYYATKK